MSNEPKKRRFFELPPLSGMPCIELSGNREAVIEGSKGVLEYAPERVCVNTASMAITLNGRGLNLRCISDTALIIDGFITGVEFTV